MNRLVRALPALLVGCLLLVALSSWVRPEQPKAPITSGWRGPCVVYPTSGLHWADVTHPNGIVQPVGYVGNAASCSLTIDRIYGSGQMEVIQTDPATLLPDPTTLALRTVYFDMTALAYGYTRKGIYPPVIVRHLPHVAEPPGQTLALKYSPHWDTQRLAYDPDGSVSAPVAYRIDASGVTSSLPGTRPVLRHVVCGGDSSDQALTIAQSVITTNTLCADTAYAEILQRFRVPAPVVLSRLEIAPGGSPAPQRGPKFVAILDAQGDLEPPASHTDSDYLTKAFLPGYYQVAWMPAFDFDPVTLQPNHDYWLLVRTSHAFALHGRTRTGSESDDFSQGIGPFFRRIEGTDAWVHVSDVSLSFKLIGDVETPLKAITGVSPSPASTLKLRATPNPARGDLTVSWSGAQGMVHLSLLDANGRRVGGADLSAAEGRWQLRSGNGAMPAGVYFARATDARGGTANQRVVVLP
jgi:hypothetical protein